jgi:hypothetical protein
VKLFSALRPRPADDGAGDGDGDGPSRDSLAIDRYDRLDAEDVLPRLGRLSQVELTEIEGYERAHAQRAQVLNKLRYLRGDEPVAGYDAMSPDDVAAALHDADLTTISRVRAYERRMRRRDAVLADVERLRNDLRSGAR